MAPEAVCSSGCFRLTKSGLPGCIKADSWKGYRLLEAKELSAACPEPFAPIALRGREAGHRFLNQRATGEIGTADWGVAGLLDF